ncbi:glycosyltransferase family 2 protein [Marinomonas sp. C2222]|uniref:Glycosyltransferase family 2 protein n=1 Tax=Marinomonas sargassi TaxID=2984494 RepID=A0ABT2YP21_9GAMM|nr:glycosyltransferase family 2 protein [Marinomonas sargassi]MCV2401634.1 glycosyltransferase family 2 protein [Marinomonas sargassi]
MIKKIPIIILTRDEPGFLKICVDSIVNRTDYPFEIIIVDNNSKSSDQLEILKDISVEHKVIYNDKNNWILGFNLGLAYVKGSEHLDRNYYVLTDGDIVVPLRKDGVCWLSFLTDSLNNKFFIGKIGLGLDISNLKKSPNLAKAYKDELRYLKGKKYSNFVLAPVDTTIAIYRSDLFVHDEFLIYPGHASLVKPYYYVFRTVDVYQAKHLGWRKYKKITSSDLQSLHSKIKCFSLFSAYMDPNELKKAAFHYRFLYKIKLLFKLYWAGKVAFFWGKYIIKKFPRNFNEIQSKMR